MLIKLLEVLSGERLVSTYQYPLWGDRVGFEWGFVNPWFDCSIRNLSPEGSALKMSFSILKEKKKKGGLLLQLDLDTIKMLSLLASVGITGSLLQRFLASKMLSASSSMFPAPRSDRHRVQNVPEPLRSLSGGELGMLGDVPGPCGQWPISLLTNAALMQVCRPGTSLLASQSGPGLCRTTVGEGHATLGAAGGVVSITLHC